MAGKAFIADIRDRDRVSGAFLIQQKQVPLNKNGKPYIAMVLMDRTGTVEGRVWDNAEQIAPTIEAGDFVDVRGVAVSYQGRVQVKVEKVKKIDSDSVDLEEFLPASSQDRGEMLNRLQTLLEGIADPALRQLVLDRLHDENFRRTFSRAPAAKTIHHAFLGGLLEHSLSVVELASRIADQYSDLDRDLLLAGAFLHDVGKIRELGCDAAFEYTDEGRLLGHIVMGAMMLGQWAKGYPALSEETLLKLTHMILSHHGSYEFGSPKRPKFIEALVLNYLDEMDSKVQTFKEIAERDQGNRWSAFQRVFDRYLFLGNRDTTGASSEKTKRKVTPDPSRSPGDEPLRHRALAEQLEPARHEPSDQARGKNGKQMTLVGEKAESEREK